MSSRAMTFRGLERLAALFVLTAGVLASQSGPRILVVVFVPEPRFQLNTFKTRVIYDVSGTQLIPLSDFDFRTAFADELLAKLSEDKRFQWHLADAAEHQRLQAPFCGRCPRAKAVSVPDKKSVLAGMNDELAMVVQVWFGGSKNDFSLSYWLGGWRTSSGASIGHDKRFQFHTIKVRSEQKLTDLVNDREALRDGANKVIEKAAPVIAAHFRRWNP